MYPSILYRNYEWVVLMNEGADPAKYPAIGKYFVTKHGNTAREAWGEGVGSIPKVWI